MILRPCRCRGADMPALGFAAPRLRFGPVRMPLGMDGATALRKGRVRTGLGAGKRPLTSGAPPPGRSCAAGAARPPPAIGFGPVPKQQFGRDIQLLNISTHAQHAMKSVPRMLSM